MIAHTLATLPTEPSAQLTAAPSTIGRFQVRSEIGRGSNGVVYAAHDPILNREVAIKAIPLSDDVFFRRQIEANFLNEAKAAARVSHPHIVTIFDAGQSDGLAYIAMERLHGRDLHDHMAAGHPLTEKQVATLMARVADAVHFAHKQGLVHRDIKPSNIFLNRDLKPKVLDFGVAMAPAGDPTKTQKRQLIGTPNYMSPEQALGRPLDARSDVFSIGTILYELLAGKRAFDGGSIEEILSQVIADTPTPVEQLRPDVAAGLAQIVQKALAKDVNQRYQTAGELRNELAAFAEGGTARGATPARTTLESKTPWLIAAGAILVIALVIGLAVPSRHSGSDGIDSAESAAVAASGVTARGATLAGASVGTITPTTPDAAAKTPAREASTGTIAPVTSPGNGGRRADAVAPARARTAAGDKRGQRAAVQSAAAVAHEGVIALAVAPWGEVIVDGNYLGVSPPLMRVTLTPGMHRIEVQNGAASPYRAEVEVKAGETVALQHRF